MRLDCTKSGLKMSHGEKRRRSGRTLSINRERCWLSPWKTAVRPCGANHPPGRVSDHPCRTSSNPGASFPARGVFPGFVGGTCTVGEGSTLVLEGAAVVTSGSIVAFQEGLIDMSGPAAVYSPFSRTNNVVLVVEPVQGIDQHSYEAALREAGFRLAWYLADKSRRRRSTRSRSTKWKAR